MLKILVILFISLNLVVPSMLFSKNQNKIRESTIIYKLKEDATPKQLKRFNALVNKNTVIAKKELKGIKLNVAVLKNIKGFEKVFSRQLMDTGAVKFAEPDVSIPPTATPNDSGYDLQWHHPKINSPTAWDNTTGPDNLDTVKVCVLDTGVDTDHPDLMENLLLPGYNAYLKQDGNVEDALGHGTGTAGVIGAMGNNDLGVAGMAWDISIIPVKINYTDEGEKAGYAYISDMAVGIEWCADQGVKVANLSYGGAQYATIDEAAQYLRDQGGLLFMSSGNDGTENSIDDFPDYTSFVVVGATDDADVKSSFSEFGAYVDIVAPGEDIATTYLNGEYIYYTGTSFSSPMTAGLAALIYAVNPDFTPEKVEDYLFYTAVDLGDIGDDDVYGHGRIDAGTAIVAAVAGTDPTTPNYTITPKELLFGTTGGQKVFIVTNPDAAIVRLQDAVMEGPQAASFNIVTDNCNGVTLAQNQSCTITIGYPASADTSLSAYLNINKVTAFLHNYESTHEEAVRRLPPVIDDININESMNTGTTYPLTWSIVGYGDDYTAYVAFFDCSGTAEGTCGESYGSDQRFDQGLSLRPVLVEPSGWTYQGEEAKRYHYTFDFTPQVADFTSGDTPIVIRFYYKSGADGFTGDSSVSLIIPGNLSESYYDTSGRKIQKIIHKP